MTAPRDLERRLTAHYTGEAPVRAPDWILTTVLMTIETTRQRRGLIAPWRFPDMPAYTKLAAAAVVVLAVGAFALWQLGRGGPGGLPTPTPTTSPTVAPTFIEIPGPTTYVSPALTQTFTSDLHGLSLSYPAGWRAQAATAPWTTVDAPRFRVPSGDFLWDPGRTDHLFLGAASLPLDGKPFEQWSTDLLAAEGCEGTETVTVDGADGVKSTNCEMALVSSNGRGYFIVLYKSGDEAELRSFDAAVWFDDILATVQLAPENAIDEVPTASP